MANTICYVCRTQASRKLLFLFAVSLLFQLSVPPPFLYPNIPPSRCGIEISVSGYLGKTVASPSCKPQITIAMSILSEMIL